MPVTLASDDPVAVALVQAIHAGDTGAVRRLLEENPALASARLRDGKGGTRTPLHVAADWPGYFPNGAAIVPPLAGAGADPSAPVTGSWHAETPLHWAASSDDLDVADTLIDAGADIEAPGASIAGGTPLDDAVGYGCWNVARRLVERGARVDKLWHAAALGMLTRTTEFLDRDPPPARPRSTTPSGRHATAASAAWQSCSSTTGRMSTGSPTTPSTHPWTWLRAPTPGGTPWPPGSASTAPGPPGARPDQPGLSLPWP